MKQKNIFSFFTGLILANIYFAIEDNKKLNKLRDEFKSLNEYKFDRQRHKRIDR